MLNKPVSRRYIIVYDIYRALPSTCRYGGIFIIFYLYQIILYFEKIFSYLYILSIMLLFVYKGYVLPYPPGSLGPEITGTIFFLIIQFVRLNIGKSQ